MDLMFEAISPEICRGSPLNNSQIPVEAMFKRQRKKRETGNGKVHPVHLIFFWLPEEKTTFVKKLTLPSTRDSVWSVEATLSAQPRLASSSSCLASPRLKFQNLASPRLGLASFGPLVYSHNKFESENENNLIFRYNLARVFQFLHFLYMFSRNWYRIHHLHRKLDRYRCLLTYFD
jgi:hypothetical protein